MIAAGIAHDELTTTAAAAQQTGQQRRAALGCARVLAAANIVGDSPLDVLELFPTHVAFVRVGNQCQPLLSGLAPYYLMRLVHGMLHALFRLAICITPAVRRVGQHAIQRAIARALPTYLASARGGGKL